MRYSLQDMYLKLKHFYFVEAQLIFEKCVTTNQFRFISLLELFIYRKFSPLIHATYRAIRFKESDFILFYFQVFHIF